MSHIATVAVSIKCLDSLEEAASQLGLELVRGQQSYRWYGSDHPGFSDPDRPDAGRCEHALRIPGNPRAYEIGLCRDSSGDGYSLAWDAHAGGYGLMGRVASASDLGRQSVGRLVQEYSLATTKRQLRREGRRFTERRTGGKIRLEAVV